MSNSQYNPINTSLSFPPNNNQSYQTQNQLPLQNVVFSHNPQNGFINNQMSSQQYIQSDPNLQNLKSKPSYVVCPNCNNLAPTKVVSKCNLGNVCCGVCFGALIWLVFQYARGKDTNCYDSVHCCGRCGVKLNEYSSC